MRIALVASESNPFCKTGGLADVVFSLAKEFVMKGHESIIVLPYYQSIKSRQIDGLVDAGSHQVDLSWRTHTAYYHKVVVDGVTFYFVEDDSYFGRENLYGYDDDGERFAFFSLASKALLEREDIRPDIVHVHDWQSAIMPLLFLKDGNSPLHWVKTVLTIHNPAFLGLIDEHGLWELFNLPTYEHERDAVRVYGKASTLLAGIRFASKITTVSPTHAEELRQYNAYQIGDALVSRGEDFLGIVNGVDYDEFDPSKDPLIAEHYNLKTVKKAKKACKNALFKEFGFEPQEGPLFVLVSRLYEQKGIPLVLACIPHIVEMGGSLLILGSGEADYVNAIKYYASVYPGRIGIYEGYSKKIAHACYAGGDFFLMPSLFEPCGISQMIAQRYCCLPVARNTGGLHDTIAHMQDGVLFNDYDEGGLRYGIDEAFRIYSDPELMQTMLKQAYHRDHSWSKSAASYLKLFESLK